MHGWNDGGPEFQPHWRYLPLDFFLFSHDSVESTESTESISI